MDPQMLPEISKDWCDISRAQEHWRYLSNSNVYSSDSDEKIVQACSTFPEAAGKSLKKPTVNARAPRIQWKLATGVPEESERRASVLSRCISQWRSLEVRLQLLFLIAVVVSQIYTVDSSAHKKVKNAVLPLYQPRVIKNARIDFLS